ncbi:MAG: hypothetical protein A2W94_07090 [Bacteroidetes bacterium GWE2_42_42]|nr:MAG: hypothetical protein A2W94_07090 [Bacteroidetes bacterium GWE2_42_42]
MGRLTDGMGLGQFGRSCMENADNYARYNDPTYDPGYYENVPDQLKDARFEAIDWQTKADAIEGVAEFGQTMMILEGVALEGAMSTFSTGAKTVTSITEKSILKTSNATSTAGKYSHIDDAYANTRGPGKNFSASQKHKILSENKALNNGVLRSDQSGAIASDPVKSVRGVKANMNQAEVDHVIPKSKGGTNEYGNAQILLKKENLQKGNR